ncbi:MAG: flagellar protein FlgN [bacterium]
MTDALANLTETLEKEAELYEQIEEVLVKERESLRRMDVPSLEESNGLKAFILGQIARLEKERLDLMSSLLETEGMNPERPLLSDLLRKAPAPWAGRLMEVRKRLREGLTRVKAQSESNGRFIDELGAVMDGFTDTLRQLFAEPALYGEKGRMGSGPLPGGGILEQAV